MIRGLARSPLARQTLWYFFAQIANGALGLAVMTVLTRGLAVGDFGAYSLVVTVLTFTALFFDFGVAASAGRLLATATGEQAQRARAGAMLTGALGLGLLFGAALALASAVADPLLGSGIGSLLLFAAPFAVVLPIQEMILMICQGAGRIGLLSMMTVLPRLLLLPALAGLAYWSGLTPFSALLVTMLATVFAAAVITAVLRPSLHGLRAQLGELRREVREFGRKTYAGRVVDSLTTGVDRMLIARWHGLEPVGYYSVAYTMAQPIAMMSRAVAGSSYRRFAGEDFIPRRVLVLNAIWCAAAAALLAGLGMLLVPLLFTGRYLPALPVLPLLAAATALAGINAVFHSFFNAQRQGRTMRFLSISTSGLNVLANLALVPFLSMTGAGLALCASTGLNLVLNLYFYRRYRRGRREENTGAGSAAFDTPGAENYSRTFDC